MAGRIIYLEIDDEITTAAARIRDADVARIAVVLPYGSRVATSRINFRLLSRDALTHEKRLSIVAADAATRALAASAGLPVFALGGRVRGVRSAASTRRKPRRGWPARPASAGAVGAAARSDGATPSDAAAAPSAGRRRTSRTTRPSRSPPGRMRPDAPAAAEPDGTLGLVVPAVAAGAAAGAARGGIGAVGPALRAVGHAPRRTPPRRRRPASSRSVARRRNRSPDADHHAAGAGVTGAFGRVRTPWLVGGAILVLALLIGGVGLYVLLPSATIVVTPRPEPVTPVELTVVADPAATQPDPAAGVVPAEEITIPVSVDDEFPATGKRVELTKATGTVRFENRDPTSTNRIDEGSIVRTASGVRFRTDVQLIVPRAELVGLTIFPARASVKVTAVDGGPEGNVEPGTIVIVPPGENGLFLKVTNPEATTGGSREEFTRVTQQDVDGALATLDTSLHAAFDVAMADPALTAGGATVFPTTGVLGRRRRPSLPSRSSARKSRASPSACPRPGR